jgi:hypothetical protein
MVDQRLAIVYETTGFAQGLFLSRARAYNRTVLGQLRNLAFGFLLSVAAPSMAAGQATQSPATVVRVGRAASWWCGRKGHASSTTRNSTGSRPGASSVQPTE